MINRTLPNDLPGYRRTEFGYFNLRPCPVLAFAGHRQDGPEPTVSYVSGSKARESTQPMESRPAADRDSRGGRIQFAGGGVESGHAPRRSKVCGGALILAQGAVSEAEHDTTCQQAGRLDTDNHPASGSCYDHPERSHSRSSDRPVSIPVKRGRW